MDESARDERMAESKLRLKAVADLAQAGFTATHEAREQALRLSREITQNSANCIRATHRGEFAQARDRLDHIASLVDRVNTFRDQHAAVYYGGYVEDALKEYSEAAATLSFAEASELPGPDDLGVSPASYMNGLAEAVGELRRFILDSLRRDDFSRSEELLSTMDDIYSILVSIDFPDAVTRGLRRSTDMARGILERTRGDLTVALRQRRLEGKLAALQDALEDQPSC